MVLCLRYAGRAGESGMALTLFSPEDSAFRSELESALGKDSKAPSSQGQQQQGGEPSEDSSGEEEEGGGAGDPSTSGRGEEGGKGGRGAKHAPALKAFVRLTRAQLEALRYRGEDVGRSITKKVVKEARAKELKLELLNSEVRGGGV